MNKTLKYYNNLEEGDIFLFHQLIDRWDKQYVLEDYVNDCIKKKPCDWDYELWDSATGLVYRLISEFGQNGALELFDGYKPERPLKETEKLIEMESSDNNRPKCTNKKCCFVQNNQQCYLGTYITDCLSEKCCSIIIIFLLGGWSGLEEFSNESKENKIIYDFIKTIWDNNFDGILEKEIYGDNMNTRCALKTLEDKGYIRINAINSINQPAEFTLTSNKMSGKPDFKILKEIHTILYNDEEFIVKDSINDKIYFTSEKAIKTWLNKCTEEETRCSHINDYIQIWIKEHTNYEILSDCNGYYVLNKEKEQERRKQEEIRTNEALDLLHKII